MNQIEQQIQEDARVAKRMLHFTGGDEAVLAEIKFVMGVAWMEKAFPKEWWTPLQASPLFWAWWKDKWAHLDQAMEADLKVNKHGVLMWMKGVNATDFFHSQEEFLTAYGIWHHFHINSLSMEPRVLEVIKKEIGPINY
ncbi:MAG: hypothetical protein V4621_08295 [Pseudomonadota bacterium]